jgi:hypothetical protein
MASPVHALIGELTPVMRRGDLAGFGRVLQQLGTQGQRLGPDELTEAVGELAQVLAYRPQGVFARLAVLAGAFVEWGASPLALADNAPACAALTMFLRVKFSELWPVVGAGQPEPDPDQPPPMGDLVDLFTGRADELGLAREDAGDVAMSWYDAPCWVRLMITLLARREFRRATDLLPDIGELAGRIAERVPRAHWLPGLAQVLDDEPVVAIDHATGRGFLLTMSGIGDNFQLHTLLAHRLIGDPARGLLAGDPPAPRWVDAATTGTPLLPPDEAIQRRFRLYDATGAYVYPEGRPADIAAIDGVRLIALHPPMGAYRWTTGRVYQHMASTLTLDHLMNQDEAQAWRSRITPAHETDFLAPG